MGKGRGGKRKSALPPQLDGGDSFLAPTSMVKGVSGIEFHVDTTDLIKLHDALKDASKVLKKSDRGRGGVMTKFRRDMAPTEAEGFAKRYAPVKRGFYKHSIRARYAASTFMIGRRLLGGGPFLQAGGGAHTPHAGVVEGGIKGVDLQQRLRKAKPGDSKLTVVKDRPGQHVVLRGLKSGIPAYQERLVNAVAQWLAEIEYIQVSGKTRRTNSK